MTHSPAATANDVLFCQRNNRLWVGTLAASAVLVLGLAVWLAYEHGQFDDPQVAALSATPVAAPPVAPTAWNMAPSRLPPGTMATRPLGMQVASPGGAASSLQNSFNQAAEAIRPAVVNISAIRSGIPARAAAGTRDPQFINPFDGIPDRVIGSVAFESVGSGVIIDPNGYVVTNDHVVANATSVMVTFFNQTEPMPARVVAADPSRDLALLQLQGRGPFPAAELGNSDGVSVGDWVLAVGNPFGLGHTVTAGIVSSRRNSLVIGGVNYTDLLQTDAPINQGSSGGPLVDLRGKVIGINTAIYAPTGVFNGTGFAIPSNRVSGFVSRALTQSGQAAVAQVNPPAATPLVAAPIAAKAWLGIHGSTVTAPMAPKLGLQSAEGVFVNVVDRNSPASEAEIRAGDVITNIAGQPATDQQSLNTILAALPPGLTVPVVVRRGGEVKTRRVKLGLKSPGRPVAARVGR